jgi:hypothetical protein
VHSFDFLDIQNLKGSKALAPNVITISCAYVCLVSHFHIQVMIPFFALSAVRCHKIDAYYFTFLLTLSLYHVALLPVSRRLHGELNNVVLNNMHGVPIIRIPLAVGDMALWNCVVCLNRTQRK